MNKEKLERIKQALLQEKEEVEKLLHSLAEKEKGEAIHYQVQFPQMGQENLTDDEGADAVEEYSLRLEEEKVLEERLQKILRALEKIEKGNYGICKVCGNEIELERLKVDPIVEICAECLRKNK